MADMIENAERIEGYLTGMDRQTFQQDGRTREAAHRMGQQAEQLMPGQPWSDIRGMGNRLRHAYDRLDLDIVWNTARDRLPALATEARRALARIRGAGGQRATGPL